MNDKDGLRYYEQEWEKEHALRLKAEQRAVQAEGALEEAEQQVLRCEEKVSQANQLLAEKVRRANQLLEEAEDNQKRADNEAESARQRLIECELLARQIAEKLQQELSDLKTRIGQHDFWQRDFAQLLAADLDFLDESVNQATEPGDWIAIFERWHKQILDGLLRIIEGEGSISEAQRLRQVILAQWVYVRWLEVTRVSKLELGL